MSSASKNLSSFTSRNIAGISQRKISIIVSEWNDDITDSLYSGAFQILLNYGVKEKNIIRKDVPGSFELPLAAQWMAEKNSIDAVICLGCIIQGETRHFEFICHSVAQGIKDVSLKFNKPVIFGVHPTTDWLHGRLGTQR